MLAGRKTLLIEQHNLLGGCATSFRRGRFEIEPSLHEICDLGPVENPGDVRTIMDQYGVKVEWRRVDDCFRIISKYSDGAPMDVTMPSGIEPFIDKMEEYVPGSRPQMTKLFDLFQEVLDGIAYITASSGHADSNVLKEKYPNMLRTGAYPTKKVFDALKLPQRAQDILATYWSYLGVDMEHLAFIHVSVRNSGGGKARLAASSCPPRDARRHEERRRAARLSCRMRRENVPRHGQTGRGGICHRRCRRRADPCRAGTRLYQSAVPLPQRRVRLVPQQARLRRCAPPKTRDAVTAMR